MTDQESALIVQPIADLCRARGWFWRWRTKLEDTHWHSSVAVWAVVGRQRVFKARYGSSATATSDRAEAGVLESAVRYSLERIAAEDETDRQFAEYRERLCASRW